MRFVALNAADLPLSVGYQLGPEIYGDGRDGSANFNGGTVLSLNPTGSEYSLARTIFCSSITVGASYQVRTNGYKIFCSGTLTVEGQILNSGGSGNNGSGVAGGAAVPGIAATEFGPSGGGGAGGYSSGAGAGGSVPYSLKSTKASAGNGGAGGGGGASGASGGDDTLRVTTALGNVVGAKNFVPHQALDPYAFALGNVITGGAGGGGGGRGVGPGGAGGGSGGGGGGCLAIYAHTIDNTYTNGMIIVGGGGGGHGGSGGSYGGGGGGGGGSGGMLLLFYDDATDLDVNRLTALGGSGGSGGSGSAGTGANGANGAPGLILRFNRALGVWE